MNYEGRYYLSNPTGKDLKKELKKITVIDFNFNLNGFKPVRFIVRT